MGRRMRTILKTLEYKLEYGFDILVNDTVITAGRFIFDLFTLTASLYYAITNALPIIPQWVWFCMFLFMIVAGTFSLEDLVYLGYDEDGNRIPDDEPEDDEDIEPEDDEIAPD